MNIGEVVASEGQVGQHTKAAYASLMSAMGGPEVFVKHGRAEIGSNGASIAPTSWGAAQGGAPSLAALRAKRAERMAQPASDRQIPDNYVPGTMKIAGKKSTTDKRASYALEAEKRAEGVLVKRGHAIQRPKSPSEVNGFPASTGTAAPAPKNQNYTKAAAATVSLEEIADEVFVPEPEPVPVAPAPIEKSAQDAGESWQKRMTLADPVKLALMLLKVFRSKWAEWEPETLWTEIKHQLGFEPHQGLRDRIMAIRLMSTTDRFHREWDIFEKIIVALHGREITRERTQHLSLVEIARVMSWARQIRERAYSDEVLAYVAATAHEEGILCLPPPIEQAQRFLDALNKGGRGLCSEVWRRWALLNGDYTRAHKIGDAPDAIDVQLARMASIAEAVRDPNG